LTLNPEKITVIAGGMSYEGWEEVEVSAAIKEAARSFRLQTTEGSVMGVAFAFPPGTPIQILANGQLVLDGYVNVYAPDFDATSHKVTISGRGKGQDFVDCAAKKPPGYWENQTPDKIAAELDLFGVGVKAAVPLKPIPYFQLNQGETAFEAAERAIRHQGATMMGEPDGSISITNARVAMRHAGGLIEGRNIRRGSAKLSDDKRHSEIEVKGQGRLGHGDPALRVKRMAMDPGVMRYRPKILINEGDTDDARAQSRADHERDRAQGLAVKATIETQGWRDDGGKLFTPNHLIYVASPTLKIMGDMLIEKVSLSQDNGRDGSIAKLDLVNAKAYGGEGGANQSDKAYS
jgi:prophage tail gpP-like protein